MRDAGLARAAFLGALVGIGLFLGATVLEGGLRPCVGDAIWDPAFDVANAPARMLAEVLPNRAVAPQQKGWLCASARAGAWSAEAFAVWGAAAYAALCAFVAAIGRFVLGGL